MLQVSAGALAQPRMPPRGFAPLRHQKETGRAPLFGVGSPPSKGNAHAIHSIISVPQEFLPARRGKLLFPARAGLRQLGQPYPRHQAGPRSQRGAARRRPVRHPRGADVGDGPIRLSGQPLRKPQDAAPRGPALFGDPHGPRLHQRNVAAFRHAGILRRRGQPAQHLGEHTGRRRRTPLPPQHHGRLPLIFTNNVEKLEEMWTDIDAHIEHSIKIVDNTVDNSSVIEVLSNIDYKSTANPDFYVNYINIENKLPKEKIVNISELNKEEGLKSIKYSSLLPFNPQGTMGLHNQFMKDLSEGLYNGYNLDGGLVNNTLLNPLLNKNLDKIIVISMKHDYTLPDEIKNICNEDNIIIVRPKTVFDKNDTLRFEKEFCKQIYYEGYEIGKNLNISM